MNCPRLQDPDEYPIDESSIIHPAEALNSTEVVRGPNIKPVPEMEELPDSLEAEVVIKVEGGVSEKRGELHESWYAE